MSEMSLGNLKLSLQGMDRSFKYTGSYDEVVIGIVNTDYVGKLIDYVSRLRYPENFDEEELCPIGIFVEAWGATLNIYYNGDGTFSIRIIDDVGNVDMDIADNVDAWKVKDFVKRFAQSRESIEELLGPEPFREYFIRIRGKVCWDEGDEWGEVCRDRVEVIGLNKDKFYATPISRIKAFKLVSKWKPKLIVEYLNSKGEVRTSEIVLKDKKELEKAYRILTILYPGKVRKA